MLDVAALVLLSDGLALSVVPFGVFDLLNYGDRFALGLIPFGIGLRGGGRGGGRRTVFTDIRLGFDFTHRTIRSFRRHLVGVRRASVLVFGGGVGFGFEPSIVGDGGLLIIGLASIASRNITHGSDVINELEVATIGIIAESPIVVNAFVILNPILPGTITYVNIAETKQRAEPSFQFPFRNRFEWNVVLRTGFLKGVQSTGAFSIQRKPAFQHRLIIIRMPDLIGIILHLDEEAVFLSRDRFWNDVDRAFSTV